MSNRLLNPSSKKVLFPLVIAAYTGKAAYNVKGLTLHGLFHLPAKGKLTGISEAILFRCQKTFQHTFLIIIDEISLVGSNCFDRIMKRVCQIKGVSINHLKVSFLVVGDFRQLPPVKDRWIFEAPTSNQYADIIGNVYWQKFRCNILVFLSKLNNK